MYDSYFVVLDSGLYLYNFNISECALIEQFNSSVYRSSNDKINLNELSDEFNSYIFCLVNEYLFIFNEKNNKTISYKLNGVVIPNNNYYNLMPYKINKKNLSFILAINEESTKFTFYYYNFPLKVNISIINTISFNDMNIQNNMIKCHLNSPLSFIKCFFYQIINSQKYFSMNVFLIKETNIEKSEEFTLAVYGDINQIKVDKSENNNYFICLTFQKYIGTGVPGCYINKN